MDEILKDSRFAHIATDPRFKHIPKSERKVKIDKRFQSMFKNDKFNIKYTVDKRGRPVKHSTDEDLKRYYELSSSEENSSAEESEEDNPKEDGNSGVEEETHEVGRFVRAPKDDVSEEQALPSHIKDKLLDLKVDYARGEGKLLSESSSDDDSELDETSEDEGVEHNWGELDKDADTTDEITHRLAACNMDWDRIRAVDLMVLFNSFVPSGSVIKSISIYPSEYGLKRMQEEEIKGPIELVSNEKPDGKKSDPDENEEGSKYNMEKLRQYQLNRLKYYYAIIVCDSPATANKLYSECDGLEYESSATKLDLRFVPNDTTFDKEKLKEVCDKMPDLNRYQPRYFTTTALQQAKVQLTWDETNPERLEVAQKLSSGKIDDISEADLQNYLANSSSGDDGSDSDNQLNSSENDDENSQKTDRECINKYKQLLNEIDQKERSKNERDIEMEVSWGVSLKEKTDKIIKDKQKNAENLTPFEKYLDKKKEKRKAKREVKRQENESTTSEDDISDIDMNDPYFADEIKNMKKSNKSQEKKSPPSAEGKSSPKNSAELELLIMNEDDSNKKHFSLKKIQEQETETKSKRKKKSKKKANRDNNIQDDFKINVDDQRFAAIFDSHHFNIDPTDPHYKKTKAMETLIQEKIKRRKDNSNDDQPENKKLKSISAEKIENSKRKTNLELNALVKSVKRKAEVFKRK